MQSVAMNALQWGHGDEAVEEPAAGTGFRPARLALQWGHGDEAVEEAVGSASMSISTISLQWGHGDEAVEEVARLETPVLCRQCFNGATAMKPWKRRTAWTSTSSRSMLQWGHGDEAVEEQPAKLGQLRRGIELQWGHGDEAVEEESWLSLCAALPGRFNGATAMKPWKSCGSRADLPGGPPRFNGATAMKPWKSAVTDTGVRLLRRASMGPRR